VTGDDGREALAVALTIVHDIERAAGGAGARLGGMPPRVMAGDAVAANAAGLRA
jgi:hypothetical protein